MYQNALLNESRLFTMGSFHLNTLILLLKNTCLLIFAIVTILHKY